MEIKFNNIILKKGNKYIIKDFNLIIKENELTGIIDKSLIIKTILNSESELDIEFDKTKKMTYIDNYIFLTKTVSDEFFLMKKYIEDKNYIEKVISSLNLVGLNKDYLTKDINTLSSSEKRLVSISLALITNPDIIIFDNVFKDLDKKYKTIIKKLILELRKKYKKTIIIIDNNINILYEICTYLIILSNDKLIISDNINKVFNDLTIFEENNIEIPFLIEFSKIAMEYNKKINYYKDINDLIKEVYRKC